MTRFIEGSQLQESFSSFVQHSNIRISMKSLFSQQFDTIEKDPAEDNFSRSEALDIWRQLKSSDSPTIKPRNVLKASKTFDSKKKMSVQPENNFNLIPTAIGGQDDDFLFDTEEQEMT